MSNPLVNNYTTPFETTPFEQIKDEHFLDAINEGVKRGKEEILKIKENFDNPTFENTIEALEKSGSLLDRAAGVFYNLHSAESTEKILDLAKEISPILSDYSNDILLDEKLFSMVKNVFENKEKFNLDEVENRLLEKKYKSFVRNGALLADKEKNRLREIDKELSGLSLKFGDNVLAEINKFELYLTEENDVLGIPEGILEAAKITAKEKGKSSGYVFTLDYPSYIPFMTYAENRGLREKMYRAATSKGIKGDELDNQENVKTIIKLRDERAKLLGYKTYSHFVLEERMAEKPENVHGLLDELIEKSLPQGKKDIEETFNFAVENGFDGENIMPWDYFFWSEKLKKDRYSFDAEALRPYFKLENVINGAFLVANKLYGIEFKHRYDIQKYHSDVKTYEVTDRNGDFLGIFYTDFFPRSGKKAGAWMTSYKDQYFENKKDIRPHISIVCNFTKPTSEKPSLLTFDEVTTLFHEFGHALHGLSSKVKYGEFSGTSVLWDFVELPSQILENWCYEKECLDLFAVHYKTGEKIPEDLVEKIKKSSTFQEGYKTLRQLSFGKLDMAWHSTDPAKISDVDDFEKKSVERTAVLPSIKGSGISCSFSHIFQGGYSSGYYSYKWAEVLDADAFESFKEKGIFNKEVADNFYENILSKGGSYSPVKLYERFKGRGPKVDALLKRGGFI